MIPTLRKIRILIIILLLSQLSAQSTSQFYHKNPNQVNEGDDILISVTMFVSDPIISGMLFFRSKDQISYQEIPMSFVGGNWEAIIPGRNVTSNGIEYVMILHKRSMGRVSIPMNDAPFDNPLFISVLEKKVSKDTIVVVNSCGDAYKDREILKKRLGKKYVEPN